MKILSIRFVSETRSITIGDSHLHDKDYNFSLTLENNEIIIGYFGTYVEANKNICGIGFVIAQTR